MPSSDTEPEQENRIGGEGVVVHPNVMFGSEPAIGFAVSIGVPPRGREPGELETRLGHRCVIRSHTVIYAGNVIGDDFQTGHAVLIRESNRIGDRVSVGSHSVVEHHVVIEDRARLHSNVFVPEYSVLEAEAWLGPNVVLTNARYPRSRDVKDRLQGPTIGAGAMIGANATILPGIRVGGGALVGAGSVVVDDVAPGKVVVGNPARVLKDVSQLEVYRGRS